MTRTFFVNGKFVPEAKAVIPVTAHALHYGTGVFEGIRAYYSEKDKCFFAFRLEDHFKRMKQSAKIVFIDIPYTVDEMCGFVVELLQRNFTETDMYVRPLAFKSAPAVGNFKLPTLQDSIIMYNVPMGKYLDSEKGVRLGISSWRRVSDNAIPPRGKITGAYINTCLTKTEAQLNGYDDALVLDDRGHVVESSSSNIFMIKDGVVITPPVSDDTLVGITRDTVIKLCTKELGLQAIERSIDRSEIYSADEAFLTGTAAEVTPIAEIDHRPLGESREVGTKLKDLFYKLVHGELEKYSDWVTKVNPK